jgi:hypothetical protein
MPLAKESVDHWIQSPIRPNISRRQLRYGSRRLLILAGDLRLDFTANSVHALRGGGEDYRTYMYYESMSLISYSRP